MVRCKGKILLAVVLAIVISAYGRAYGIVTPGDYSPVVAYNSLNNSYLILYFKFEHDTQSSVRGQLINPYGIPYGPEFVVSITASYNPSIAYDSVNQRYMVVWNDIRSNYWDIWGHLLNPDGTLNGKEFFISINPSSQEGPSIAYDSATQRFLVAWADDRNSGRTDWDIYGQLVNSDGTLNGPDFFICNAPNGQSHPVVSYDSVNKRFLVAWMDYRGGSSWDIYGQFVNPDGTRAGTNFVISDTPSQQYSPGNIPSLAYDSINQKFLVVWQDIRSGTSYGTYGHVYGQLVNWDGTLNGVNFVISNAPESQLYPSIAYDNAKQRFLVVWQDNRGGSSWDIYGQLVNPDGNLDGENFVISDAPYTKVNPSVAYNPRCGNFLVAFQTLDTSPYGIGFAIAGTPCLLTDVTPPVLTLPNNVTVECTGPQGTVVNFVVTAMDAIDGVVPVTCTPASGSTFLLGITTVMCSAIDNAGNTATGTFNIMVNDTVGPAMQPLIASPNVLWPPNHKMVPVSLVAQASDTCDPNRICKIVSINSNEPDNGLGDGDTSPDWKITGNLTANLRSERSGKGSGRNYTINVQCMDGSLNTSIGTVNVSVPHDLGKK